MDSPEEGKQKAPEDKASEYDPDELKRKRYYAQFDKRAHDEFGRPLRHVVVTDINIPFWSMVGLLVQLALAAIPAVIILGLMFEAVRWAWTFLVTLMTARP